MTTKFYIDEDGTPMMEFDSGVTLPIAAWSGPVPQDIGVMTVAEAKALVKDQIREYVQLVESASAVGDQRAMKRYARLRDALTALVAGV